MNRLFKIILYSTISILLIYITGILVIQVGHHLSSVTSREEILRIPFEWNFIKSFKSFSNMEKLILHGLAGASVLLVLTNIETTAPGRQKRRWFQTKYERENYSQLLPFRIRKRGSFRVMYNTTGKIYIGWLESLVDNIKDPFVKKYNSMMQYYLRSEIMKWFHGNQTFEIAGHTQHHKGGIPLKAYREYYLFGKFNKVFYLMTGVHSAFIGSTGRGKSMSFVLPLINSMIDSGECLVVHDPKKELYAYSKDKLEREGYKVIVLNFDDPSKGDGWNPLEQPYKYWKNALDGYDINDYSKVNMSKPVEMVLDMANTLAFEEDAKQPYFWQGAASMIAGASLLLMEEGKDEYVNLPSVRHIFTVGDDAIKGKETSLSKYLHEHRSIESDSFRKLSTYLDSEGVTKASILSVFNNKTDIVTATQNIREMTSKSTFDMEDIFKEKTAVFLLTQDEKATYYPLVTIFLKQLYEVAIKVSKENEGRKLKIPMNWVIDEFGTLPEIKDIENIYAAARSRGIRLFIFFQSISQLESKYGENVSKTILDNNDNLIYLGSATDEVRDYFVKQAGTETFWNKDKKEYDERPIITSDRLKRLEKGRSVLTSLEWGSYIIKIPPFNKYIFYEEPNWETATIEKPAVSLFDIRKELFNKRRKRESDNSGVEVKEFQSGDALNVLERKTT